MMESNYEQLVDALRYCVRGVCKNCSYFDKCKENGTAMAQLHNDAAAAIEDLQAEVEELKAKKMKLAENSLRFVGKVRELDKRRLEPKRGEWVEDTTTYAGPGLSNYKCSLCGKICGTWRRGLEPSELPNWCGNCGADLRAKTEVQE